MKLEHFPYDVDYGNVGEEAKRLMRYLELLKDKHLYEQDKVVELIFRIERDLAELTEKE